jgi:hypothetical protein
MLSAAIAAAVVRFGIVSSKTVVAGTPQTPSSTLERDEKEDGRVQLARSVTLRPPTSAFQDSPPANRDLPPWSHEAKVRRAEKAEARYRTPLR